MYLDMYFGYLDIISRYLYFSLEYLDIYSYVFRYLDFLVRYL
jgi:hypothetical protein